MTVAAPERPAAAQRSLSTQRLRLWLRLLRASRGIETELRERLRTTYGMTLPQFDVLAVLSRRKDGATMTELSRSLMVSNGNVTWIIDRLVTDGLVVRARDREDRRATVVRLTRKGSAEFASMAHVHESWIDELLSRFSKAQTEHLVEQLDGLVVQLRQGGKRQ